MSGIPDEMRQDIDGLHAGLAENTIALNEVKKQVNSLETRLNKIDLNGHGPKLKDFLDHTAPKLEVLTDYADEIIASARESRDGAAFWRVAKRFSGWDKGMRVMFQLSLGGLLAAVAYFAIAALLHLKLGG